MPAAPARAALVRRIAAQRLARTRRRRALGLLMLALLAALAATTLALGRTAIPAAEVLRALLGDDTPAAFAVRELRLPRAALSILAGMSFGLGGVAFQTMLRNPLASPDIIGVSSGASAAAVAAVVLLDWTGPAVPALAVAAGLATALAIHLLSGRGAAAGGRLILIGVGAAAMLQSVIAYALSQAPAWTLQEALRWLTGSVNGATLAQAKPLLAALVVFGGVLLACRRDLEAMRLGDDCAAALGVAVGRTRAVVIVAAVGLIAVATAVVGPIAFVAFLSGPIAARVLGPGRAPMVPAALTGALLVLAADHVGQNLLPGRYPVGVVTGALGAPYLLYLIVRADRGGVGP
jgi:iron complex transport system permease protein